MVTKYISFDPSKHEGKPLFEIQSIQESYIVKNIIVPSKATFDEAKNAPFYYFVEA